MSSTAYSANASESIRTPAISISASTAIIGSSISRYSPARSNSSTFGHSTCFKRSVTSASSAAYSATRSSEIMSIVSCRAPLPMSEVIEIGR